MSSFIRWAIGNSPAMNTLVICVLIVGTLSMFALRREEFPDFELEMILVTVPYPGASPDEIESGICQKIEEAIGSIDGIKKQTSVAAEGMGTIVIEVEPKGVDVQRVLDEVRSEVDRISTFPDLAEKAEVRQVTMRRPAIAVAVLGPDADSGDGAAELRLREEAERVRDDLLLLPAVTQADIVGGRDFQIDVELSEQTLREYGLTLQETARIIRRENIELPGGTMKTDAEEVLLRGKNKRRTGVEIEDIPLVTQPGGTVLTVGDLGTVRDEFTDITAVSRIDGKPGLAISVTTSSREDMLATTASVRDFVASHEMPEGYELRYFKDRSVNVKDRLEMLTRNGIQGLLLVFLVLAVFLELRLAFWVSVGIPISLLGTCAVLLAMGETLNMLSMFAFLMALGIVVDDAIVIGENVYAHRQSGKSPMRAAIDGTLEVIPSVTASVATTIIAFIPMMFVSGMMGKFFAILPVAIIVILTISLMEATFVLPCHLAHPGSVVFRLIRTVFYPFRWITTLFAWLNRKTTAGLERFIERTYLPLLRWCLRNPLAVVAGGIALMTISVGAIRAGLVPWVFFPKLDSNAIEARITYPDGTPASVTAAATQRLERAISEIGSEYDAAGEPVLSLVHRVIGSAENRGNGMAGAAGRASGSHLGSVSVELLDTSVRDIPSERIIDEWRRAAGEFAGAESVTFGAAEMGPAGTPIEFKLLASAEDMDRLEEAVAKTKARLAEFPGVHDISDDSNPGKTEFQLRKKDRADALGIPLGDITDRVRATYYGEEVMRLQRGRHEVRLMVRYPPEERRSLADFENIQIRTAEGAGPMLTELADVRIERGYSEINRIDQQRSITISADVNEAEGNAAAIVNELKAPGGFIPQLLEEYPEVAIRWEGQQEQQGESIRSLMLGFVVALLGMFALLTFQFRSYGLPLLIMAIIPFGIIGAVWGHAAMGLPLTLFSMLGLVALTGVVVNDSIVLIDFINHRVRDGIPLEEALLDAGRRRFRPVLLTSVTTIAGLLPVMLERSFQAQLVIPMAASLAFGLMSATVLVLILIPTFYLLYAKLPATAPEEDPAAAVLKAVGHAATPLFAKPRT
ncbi:MAG: efflux RND transporter permease subunit [Planctomycetaceae bacterium]